VLFTTKKRALTLKYREFERGELIKQVYVLKFW